MKKEFICKNCNYIGEVDGGEMRGNFWVSTILWTLYMIPGIIYSIWRRSAKKRCKKCGSGSLIKLNSAEGKKAMEKILLDNLLLKKH